MGLPNCRVTLMRLLAVASASSMAVAYAGTPDLWGHGPAATVAPASDVFRLLPLATQARAGRDADGRDAAGRYTLEWDIAPGYYLYKDRIKVTAVGANAGNSSTGLTPKAQLPQGLPHHDDHFGDIQIYRGDVAGAVVVPSGVKQIKVRFQGCADEGICYPPQDVVLDVPSSTPAVTQP